MAYFLTGKMHIFSICFSCQNVFEAEEIISQVLPNPMVFLSSLTRIREQNDFHQLQFFLLDVFLKKL